MSLNTEYLYITDTISLNSITFFKVFTVTVLLNKSYIHHLMSP